MAIETITLSYDWWEAIVEVDDTPSTIRVMKEQLLFWGGGQEWIDEEDGDIKAAYLKKLGRTLLVESMEWNLKGVLSAFENREGWAPLDGTYGVKLTQIDSWGWSQRDIEIS
jgi:hypothetical protein